MIVITVRSARGEALATVSHAQEALLRIDREYQPGDHVEITGAAHLVVQLDAALLPAEVYLPQSRMTWPVPQGDERLAYAPGAFSGTRHLITARAMTEAELRARRNVACDPADLRGETDFFPHCTANVETRGESCFAARNVIDGVRIATGHGEWPYQSWGIGAREDAWCRLDFGREVAVDEIALTLRADFPHDAYWTGVHIVLSDGTDLDWQGLARTGDRQSLRLDAPRRVAWMRLERMQKSDDPSAFPALIEWEVYGKDVL